MRQDFAIHSFTRYETRDQDLGKGVVRLHNCWSNNLNMKRGALVKITALEGDQIEGPVYCIYRAKNVKGLGQDTMGLEYDNRLRLGVPKVGSVVPIQIEKACWVDWIWYLKDHPDPTIRAQFLCTSWLTVIAGLIGLIIPLTLA
jgi:hypothetical protein